MVILAEAVSIDGGLLLFILVASAVIVAMWCALVVLGCHWARQAGRGSRRAGAGWAVAAVVQTLPLVVGLTPLALLAVALLTLQAALFLRARARTGEGR